MTRPILIIHAALVSLALISCASDEEIPPVDASSDAQGDTDVDPASTDTIAPGSCASDDECGREKICEGGMCYALPCLDRAECGSGRVCLASGYCERQECFADADCSAPQTCSMITGLCVP